MVKIEIVNGNLKSIEGKKVEVRRHIGQFYTDDDDVYILAQPTSSSVALICLTDGKRWRDPFEVDDVNNIDDDEWEMISGGIYGFKLFL